MDELPLILEGEDKSSPFLNCLRNNYRHIRKWAKRTKTNAFRLYDKEVAGFPVAIDYYDGKISVHYYGTESDKEEPPESLTIAIQNALKALIGIEPSQIFWRTRAKTKESRQYEKQADRKDFFVVQEYGVKFWVNLVDYLDTGLFLDHRETRHRVFTYARGKRVLNLFSYTAAFSVHAALGGANYTKSVDMSNTYCRWAEDNFNLNDIDRKNHDIVRADCMKFLREETARYDLIIIDPPTISRSTKMEGLFDIQQDYPFLIEKALELLNPGGELFFSTNFRRFKWDETLFPHAKAEEITDKTRAIDFQSSKGHRAWRLTK